jgi:thymidylate synthase ThyX
MRASANLRNWLGFLTLRMAPNAQQEIRALLNEADDISRRSEPSKQDTARIYRLVGGAAHPTDLKPRSKLTQARILEVFYLLCAWRGFCYMPCCVHCL